MGRASEERGRGEACWRQVGVRLVVEAGTEREAAKDAEDAVVVERSMAIALDGSVIHRTACSPCDLEYLAAGYLVSEGHLRPGDRILALEPDAELGILNVSTDRGEAGTKGQFRASGLGGATVMRSSPSPGFSVEPAFLCEAIDGLLKRSRLFRETGGCHSAELHGRDGFVFGHDDIGRHNAVDKVVGHAVLAGVALGDKVLAITGRMASDIVKKAAVAGIPILASKAPPTDLAVKAARSYGITIAGFVRGRRLTVYSGADRVLGGRKTAL